jgi:enoyl-CoA hydratase
MDLGSFLIGDRPNGGYRGFAGIVEAPPTKPIVAAVEGAAVAGGFEIVLSCDVVVAAENARFGLPEVQRGLVAAGGALLRLPRRVPYQRAMEWVLTGRFLSASEVADAGLISRVVAPGAALGNALDIAESIAANGPLAVAASKRIIVESQDWTRAEEFSRQSEISEPVRNSTDAREGALAFQQKRQPIWRGV